MNMKKLTLTITALVALAFVACEVEPVGEELSAVEGKGKIKAQKIRDDKEVDCLVDLFPSLPEMINACTTTKGEETLLGAYFDLTINDTELAGDYAAWCVDVDLSLGANECYDYIVYSSYSDLPAGAFENPENFDLVNWIVNQDFISLGYTFGDIQWAIWELLDDQNCIACSFLGNDWSVEKGQEIVDAALANGEGYEPSAGDQLAIVLLPTGRTQSIIVTIPLECDEEKELSGCETAFAKGDNGETCFIGNGFNRWGWTIGPLADGAEGSYEVYAGAGQCDTAKGVLVGSVDVSYIGGEVSVTYNIDDTYEVSETHTYAGSTMYPIAKNGKETVAPGQYYIEENLSGEIYVIAHAVVCSDGGDE